MTPATYGSVIRSLGDAALAGIPLADAPGGSIVGTPPIGVVPPALLVPVTAIVPRVVRNTPLDVPPASPPVVPVPEPASLPLLLAGVFMLFATRLIA